MSPQIIDSVNNDTIESLSVLEPPSRHQEIDSEATVSLTLPKDVEIAVFLSSVWHSHTVGPHMMFRPLNVQSGI